MFGSTDGFSGFSNMDGEWSKNLSWAGNSSGFSQAAFSGNSTFSVINEFKFLAARSIRTSTIVLASFNTISAFATAAGIFYDCYSSAKRNNTRGKDKVNVFTCVQGPELYPFILSLGITVQGVVFAVSQAQGLNGLFSAGCALVSQFMWPAILIVPYIQLVFGLEVTIRALRTRPFPPRSKWDVSICLAVIKIMLLGTGLVAFFIPAPNFCFASLFWFVAKWAEGGFVLLLGIAVILVLCTVVLFLKLTRYANIETSQRVGASRMVYYLAVGVVSNALMVPFFLYLTFSRLSDDGGPGLTLSMIATVVANVTGLMTGGLHLFLRSNTISTIGPKNKLAEYERQKLKYQIRKQSPNDTDFNSHMLQPVPGPQPLRKTESLESLAGHEKDGGAELLGSQSPRSPDAPNPLRSNAVFSPKNLPGLPEPAQIPTSVFNAHSRKPSASYRLFPSKNQGNTASIGLLPSTTYTLGLLPSTTYSPNSNTNLAPAGFNFNSTNDTLRPPPLVRAPGGHHRRDSSMASSATVQIGLRFSNVEDMPPMASQNVIEAENTHTLDCPNRPEPGASHRPSPLAHVTSTESIASASRAQSPASSTSSRYTTENTAPASPGDSHQHTKDCTLNPTVYNPNSPTRPRVPSPKGVGFNVPQRSNATPVPGEATEAPSRNQGNSTAAGARSDWI
ncbi:Uu.00g090840.m01.CDS01 [Anthostomella pinea]|uniref:Uu.00g090840.m01.CDS01 n=1 Tax=Anthostomella pinea TaxID=933095 RepID=A0AAI8VHI9_9PEZI|nr:Uu.00g090840.m01.CDS01 [Anthostomella pinea]